MAGSERRQPQRIARRRSGDADATRIESVRLRREVARLRAERAAVAQFIAEANRADNHETSLRALVSAAHSALGAAGTALYLYDVEGCTADAVFVGYTDEGGARAIAIEQKPRDFCAEQIILDTKKPLAVSITPDALARPAPDDSAGGWHTLTLPLRPADRVVGCLQFSRTATERPYSPDEMALGHDLAALAGLIVGRFQHEAEIRQRAIRADALREVGRQLSSELDFDRFLDSAAAHLMALLNVRDCLLLTWNEAARELTPELYIGDGERRAWGVKIRPDEQRGLTGAVVNERRTIHVANYLDECRRRAIEPVMPPGEWTALAWVGVPLLVRGHLVGVIVVERHGQRFAAEEVIVLESLAGQLAAAMENARLYAEVRQLATTDPLTGLANHRHIHERLYQEIGRAVRHEHPLTVAMLDLDQFKHYNDTCGHQAGDALLRAIADALRAELHTGDLAGRYGGDEFLLILPETTSADATRLIARIHARLAALTTPANGAGCPIVTASAGVAAYPETATGAHELIAQADAALYVEKRASRSVARA